MFSEPATTITRWNRDPSLGPISMGQRNVPGCVVIFLGCYRHIEDLAQSINRRELTDSVIVLVEPGLADPDRVSPNMFCCFLCQRDGA